VTATSAKPLQHLPALDGLRGIAILVVMVHNLRRITEPFPGDALSLAWVKLADMGWIGVQLFFVLSGFLITRILLNTQPAQNYFSGFYARRALRIFPLYYGTLIVWLVLLPALGFNVARQSAYDIYWWVFLSNWIAPFHQLGNGLGHFWSLAVEEQFYLLWPLAVWRLSARGLLRLCGVLSILSLVSRAGLLWAGAPSETVYEFTICRMDALAMGGAVAAAMAIPALRDWLAARARWMMLAASAVFLVGAGVTKLYRQTGFVAQTAGYSLLAAAFAIWVLAIALDAGPAWLRTPFLRIAGKYSYALYVFHFPLDMVWRSIAKTKGYGATSVAGDVVQAALLGAITLVLAMMSYRLIESPALRFKHRFEPVFQDML
jgi:peptidoglycan/LPS O-acetylase OafA/YrhL